MTKRSTFTCDDCGTEMAGQLLAQFGVDSVPEGWLSVHVEDLTWKELQTWNLHYCKVCAPRIKDVLALKK